MTYEGSISTSMDAMGIAEDIAPFFKSKIKDAAGNTARYISVKNVNFTKTHIGNIVEYKIRIQYLSDQGDLMQPIVLREFKDDELFTSEINRYNDVENRCLYFQDVDLTPMIKIDHQRRYIIYEEISGFSLDQISIPENLKDYITGRICGILHGKHVLHLDENSIRELLVFLLMHLPFSDEEKASVANLLEAHFKKFGESYGGYKSFTIFLPDQFVFELKNPNIMINKESIANGKVLQSWLRIEIPEELTNDRMNDVAEYYADRCFTEFVQSGEIEHTKNAMREFFDGYLSVIKFFKIPSFKELYPSGMTLELQLLLTSWLNEAEKIQIGATNDLMNKDLLRYSYHMMQQLPFSDFIDIK